MFLMPHVNLSNSLKVISSGLSQMHLRYYIIVHLQSINPPFLRIQVLMHIAAILIRYAPRNDHAQPSYLTYSSRLHFQMFSVATETFSFSLSHFITFFYWTFRRSLSLRLSTVKIIVRSVDSIKLQSLDVLQTQPLKCLQMIFRYWTNLQPFSELIVHFTLY